MKRLWVWIRSLLAAPPPRTEREQLVEELRDLWFDEGPGGQPRFSSLLAVDEAIRQRLRVVDPGAGW